ncbi:MAG: threonine ammonia-lyase [Inquilinaceae bacterium]
MTDAVTVDHIRDAAAAIAAEVPVTPTVTATRLSARLGCRISLKLENLHHTGSFKERGALNKLRTLDDDQRRRGVVAMSAGNHAQAVAYHAARFGIPATIVMPRHTPFTKVASTEGFGASVVLIGDSLSEARAHAEHLADTAGLTLIHPYDDPAIIAGQGTIALEMLEVVPDLEDLVVPIGGGGLISGIAVAAKALKPDLRILGVEAALYPSMSDTLAGVTRTYHGATVAEGIAVKEPGRITRRIVRRLVDDIILADEPALERAVHLLLTDQKLLAEGAGAAALAAVMVDPARFTGRRVGLVICGGNIDSRMLSSILMRGLVRDGQLVRIRIEIEDAPGALSKVSRIIGETGGNIVEVIHQRLFFDVPVKRADLDVVLETRDRGHVSKIIEALAAGGFPATIMSALG